MSQKIQYLSNLYLGESISEKKLDKIKAKIDRHPILSGVWLIAISRNPKDQLEILSARQLEQKYYDKYPIQVIGIAASYEEAVAVVEKMVQECLAQRGDCALKEYLLC